MERGTRQALFIMIDNIEKQLSGVKTLLGMSVEEPSHRTAKLEEKDSLNYTSPKDDDELDRALAIQDDEKQSFMQDLYSQVTERAHE